MGYRNWLRKGRRRKAAGTRPRGKAKRGLTRLGGGMTASLGLEALEDRRMLTTFLVTTTADVDSAGASVVGGLRWAIGQANAADDFDTIIFSDSIFVDGGPTTISFTGVNQIVISQPLSIIGPSAREVTIRQNRGNRRVFDVNDGSDDTSIAVQISGVTLSGGNITGTGDERVGGAIFNNESLTMQEVVLTGNSATLGGGAIYNTGSLSLERSLLTNNSGGWGGAIKNGGSGDDDAGSLNIENSTLSGNVAFGGVNDAYKNTAYGGAVFNRRGTVNIFNSTITANNTSGFGAGVAGWGDEVDDEGVATGVHSSDTNIYSSILFGNGNPMGMPPGLDAAIVGSNDSEDTPAIYEPTVYSLGRNIFGVTGSAVVGMSPPVDIVPPDPMTDPPDLPLGTDPLLLPLDDYGGSTNVYMLDPTSPALDAGDDSRLSDNRFESRGRHFVRSFDYTNQGQGIADIGATERQRGTFVVDHLVDEQDLQTSQIYTTEIILGQPVFRVSGDPYGTGGGLSTNSLGQLVYRSGDFSLREALQYSQLNPDLDTITFNIDLPYAEGASSVSNPPTIRLTNGALSVNHEVIIQGPAEYILEIDASGNDPTPAINNGDGSRVFNVTGSGLREIKNLTIMGSDVVGRGGGIQNTADLLISALTFKDNNATDDGGGMLVLGGKVRIENSTFKGNRAADDGGGLVVDGATAEVLVLNSTFSGNVAGDRGAGILNQNGKLDIKHSTITLNNASSTRGSGVWVATDTALTSFFSTIISGNVSNNDVEFALGVSPTTITSLGYNLVGGGVASPATPANGSFTAAGDLPRIFNPMLAPLMNTGGLIETHRPITGSPVIDVGPQGLTDPFLITPTAVTSNTTGDVQSADHLIDNSGLSPGTVTLDNYRTVGHSLNASDGWLTADPGAAGGSYFDDLAPDAAFPSLTFTLPELASIRGMVLWPNSNSMTDGDIPMEVFVESSVDGGLTFAPNGNYNLTRRTNGSRGEFGFDTAFFADTIRITILSNFAEDPDIGGGGAQVSLGEVKFTNAFDQRGSNFARVFDGDQDGTARMDIGAYELQSSVFSVSTLTDENDGNVTVFSLSLREAIQLANDNPLPDVIRFDSRVFGDGSVINLGGTFAPNTTADMKITADLKIEWDGDGQIVLDLSGLRDNASQDGRRAFTIDDLNASHVIDVEIVGLNFRNSLTEQSGGVIFSHENLVLAKTTFINNSTVGDGFHGGAIFMEKPAGAPASRDITLTIDASLLTGNHTDGVNSDGGAIYAKDVAVFINNYTTISGNSTTKTGSDGGGVFLKSTIAAAPANFNLDANVDGFDFLTWQRGFGLGTGGKTDGDANGDAVVNTADYNAWKSGFGATGNQGGILNVTASTISGNLTGAGASDGGGVFSDAGQMVFTDAVVSGNVTTGSNSEGGGIAAVNSTISLVRTVVSLNETFGSQSFGGGIYLTETGGGSTSVTLDDSIVSQNVTHGQSSSGGGLYLQEATVIARNSTFDGNRTTGSDSHGGGIANLSGTLSVINSTISNNRTVHASGKGGGVYTDTNLTGTHSTLILNSTVSGNVAGIRGGGVFNADGLTEIKHSTIANNATPFFNSGSGVASVGNSATLTRINSSIVAGNQQTQFGAQSDIDFVETFSNNSFESGGFNLLGSGNALGDFAGGGNITGVVTPALIGLAPLADNGGQDLPLGNPQTHALLAGSLAKNAGNPAFSPNSFSPPLLFDQRGAGFARVVLGRIDVGAFESPVFPVEAALTVGDELAGDSALMIESAPADGDLERASLPSLASTGGVPSLGFSRVAAANWLSDRIHLLREPESVGRRLRSAAFDAWTSSADDDLTLARPAREGAHDGGDDGLSAEDAVFEMFADGLDL